MVLSVDESWARYVLGPSTSSAPSFATMDLFYDELKKEVGHSADVDDIIKPVFETQHFGIRQLPNLTDAKLKEDGIIQRGLREAILTVLGLQ